MTRVAIVLLIFASGCFESHRLGVDIDDSALDGGPRDLGRDLGRPGRDLGPPPMDGGTGCDRCVAEVIEWGPDGGLAFERTWWQLSPCDRVLERTTFADGTAPTFCTAALGELECGFVDHIEALVRSPTVAMLRDVAPVVVGIDSRPVDGQILGLRIGGDEIGVGGDCGDDPDCLPVPPELRELADVLAQISDRLRAPALCEPLMATETFQCGGGADAPSCVMGHEVCYLDRFESPRCAVPTGEENRCVDAPHCDCLLLSLAESCVEDPEGEVVVRWVGP